MKKGQVEEAVRRSLTQYDKWSDITGVITKGCSYDYEIQALIEEATHIGIQMALNGNVDYDEDGNVILKNTKVLDKDFALVSGCQYHILYDRLKDMSCMDGSLLFSSVDEALKYDKENPPCPYPDYERLIARTTYIH